MIKRLKPKSEFSRNVMILMSGSILAQAIPLIVAPILTRLYTPEEFGVYALFFSFVSILTIVATARYEMAIMLPKSNRTSMSIVYLSATISILISLFTLVLVLAFHKNINKLLGIEVAFLIPLMVVVAGLFQSMKMWLTRQKNYKQLAISRVEQSVMGGVSQLTLGALSVGSLGLIIGQVIGQLIATMRLGFYTKKAGLVQVDRKIYIKAIVSFKRYFLLGEIRGPCTFNKSCSSRKLDSFSQLLYVSWYSWLHLIA